MSDDPIDLDAQIENLRGLKADLEACYCDTAVRGEPGIRFPLGIAIGQLAQRIAALEEVVRHHGADEIELRHLSLDENRAVDRALVVLDGELTLDPDGRATKLWSRIRAVLVAADDLLLATARGERVRTEDDERPPRPRIVLPLVRSS
jgi:hypothetical protein